MGMRLSRHPSIVLLLNFRIVAIHTTKDRACPANLLRKPLGAIGCIGYSLARLPAI